MHAARRNNPLYVLVLFLLITQNLSSATSVDYTGDPEYVSSPYQQVYNIPNLPATEINSSVITEYICGETPAQGIGDNCYITSETRRLYKETITEGTEFDKRRITVKNTGYPHKVHLDILLCYKILESNYYQNKMMCNHVFDNLYDGQTWSQETDSHISNEIYVYIIGREGTGDDQTGIEISSQIVVPSNNDHTEPRLLVPHHLIDDTVCQESCDSIEDEDSSDAYVIDFIKGDSLTVDFWSTECEPNSGNINYQIHVLMLITRPDRISNQNYTIWKINERNCGQQDGIFSINITEFGYSGRLTFIFLASDNHQDFNPASYSVVLSHYDVALRDYEFDFDGDGFTDFAENQCNTNHYDLSDYPNDLDGDGECDYLDIDDDNDGIADTSDKCPMIYFNEVETGLLDYDYDGCQDLVDEDDDNDGIKDVVDICPFGISNTSSSITNDYDGDGCLNLEDTDDDNDSWDDETETECYTDPLDSSDIPLDTDKDDACDIVDDDDDNDGYQDYVDVFPKDIDEWEDTDNDGIGNNADDDDDGDGFDDTIDKFPLDYTQTSDLDGDGCGDNSSGLMGDLFPSDSSQCMDSDNDGYGDNQSGNNPDRFPNDSSQWFDSDNDGYGDNVDGNNPDLFPMDDTQWFDSDKDGYGDNKDGNNPDQYPYDPTQWNDTDGDGFGDNPLGVMPDSCPNTYGSSIHVSYGCPDEDSDGWPNELDDCPNHKGTSSYDRRGCSDTDRDGFSDPDIIELSHPYGSADAFPFDITQWFDRDGDGYGDNITGNDPDDCPSDFGLSIHDRKGCLDSDQDGWSDENDAFPQDLTQWQDTDMDGFGDNQKGNNSDKCIDTFGTSDSGESMGCPDKDNDGIADMDDHCDEGKNEIQKIENTCIRAVFAGDAKILQAQGAVILLCLPTIILLITRFISGLRKNT